LCFQINVKEFQNLDAKHPWTAVPLHRFLLSCCKALNQSGTGVPQFKDAARQIIVAALWPPKYRFGFASGYAG
jgi:hypothetical protein